MSKVPDERPPTNGRILPLTLLAVLVAGLTGAILNPALLDSPDSNLVDGSWASDYQDAFGESFVFLEPSQAAWNALDLAVFGQGPESVIAGADDWLFTAEEFAHAAQPERVRQEWVDQLASVHELLSAQGVPLLVALVPSKAASVPELAPPLPQAGADRYAATLEDLAALGIETVDLRAALRGRDAWLRTDTHWTPQGADRAAALIAARMLEVVPELPVGALEFAVEEPESVDFRGDLDRLLALGPFASIGPPADRITVQTVVQTSEPSGGLFDDATVDAVLVGTSYSEGAAWNLADRLRLELGVDILDLSEAGSGPLAPMADFLAGAALTSSPPRLVVWELPERYLTDTTFLEELP